MATTFLRRVAASSATIALFFCPAVVAAASVTSARQAGEQQDPEQSELRANAVRMGAEGLVAPRQLTTELPEYTADAKERGLQGDVYIEAVVTKEGKVAEPRLVRGFGDDELNRRALEAIAHWTFEPGTRDSEPVDVLALFTVTFRIH